MTTNRSMLAALALALTMLGHSAVSAATTSPPRPPPGSPVALAQDMIQAARHDMTEDPAKAEQRAREFGSRIQRTPATRDRAIAVAKSLWVMGEAANRQNQPERASAILGKASNIATKVGDAQTIADIMISRAVLNEQTGRPGEAVRLYQSAFRIYQTLGNRRSQSITLQNLGMLYVQANDPIRGARYMKQAAGVYRDEPLLLATLQNTLGNIHERVGRGDMAERDYSFGIAFARKANAPTLEMLIIDNRVRTLLSLGQTAQAVALNKRAQALVAGGVEPSNHFLAIQAIIAGIRGDKEGAQGMADDVVRRLRRSQGALPDPDIHQLLYTAFKGIGDAEAALRQLEIAFAVQTDQTKATMSAQTALLGARFDYASQDLRIAQLKGEKMQQSVIEGRRTLTWLAIIATTILIAMGIGLHTSWRSRRRISAINLKLERTNTELQSALDEVLRRAHAERQAIQLSEHDMLTGLANRRHLMGSLLRGVVEEEDAPTPVAIMLLDLDRFKPINDIHGHEIGDMLLIEVAARLRALCAVRRAKAIRLGGDEFVVVCALENGEDGESIAVETIAAINKPFDIDGRRLTVGVSIGVSVYDRDGNEVSDLLRKADISMYEAKRQGRNGYRFFDAQMDTRLRERAQTEVDLQIAVDDEMIDVNYQPIRDFATGRTASFEALARWNHPLRGAVSPEEFIPIAEDIGLIARITDIVLRQACRTAREWPSDVSVSVNLSPMLLGDEWIAPRIHGILADEGLPPHRLIIEITETAVISDVGHAAEVIASLRDSGIRVALDDFGKGHSSLSQLHELAFDYLKLDCSFVRTLDNPHSMKISAAVSGLAKAMEIPVTAEGIETPEIAAKLKAMGFTYGQGYLFGRPMTAPQARDMVWRVDGEDDRQVGSGAREMWKQSADIAARSATQSLVSLATNFVAGR